MKQIATVIETDGNMAVIEVSRASACEGCHKNTDGEGCAACVALVKNKPYRARARNDAGAAAGERVEIETDSRRVLFYAALVFVLPIAAGLAFYFIGGAVSSSLWAGYGLSFAAFCASFAGLYFYSKRIKHRDGDIVITRVK